MTNEVNRNAQPAKAVPPAFVRPKKVSWVKNIDWSWLVWLVGFFIVPSIVRIITHLPVTWAISSYWELDSLGGVTQAVANRMLGFADFYGRTTITYIMLIVMLFILLYLVLSKKIDVRKWGLSFGNILPAVVFFIVTWVFVYFLYVPYASAFSAANFYIGMPLPPGADIGIPYTTYGSLGETLELMFIPKIYPVYTLTANYASPFETNYLMGLLDFFRVWFLNAPILFSMTWGYFYNSMKEKLGAIRENFNWKHYGKVLSIFFLTSISIPVMQVIYRKFDELLSHQVETTVTNATQEAPKILSIGEPYFFIVVIAVAVLANILSGSSFKGQRVKDKSTILKWIVGVVVAAITVYVVFAGESTMDPMAFTFATGICSLLFVTVVSWLVFDPAETSTGLGFSEISKWLPGAVIVILSTATYLIFQMAGADALISIPIVLTVAFWLIAAFIGNYMWKWLVTEPRENRLDDWGRSLSKWVPGTLVFIVGFGLSLLNGWHTAPGIYGPFSNSFGLFTIIMLCGWIYIRTENLIAAFLLYASFPWFLNFVQVQGFEVPTVAGSVSVGVFVLFAVLVLVESYRLWAPYITFDLEVIRKPILDAEGTPEQLPQAN